MKYSILVPVYNVEKYLSQCLDSLVGQTFRDFEVILADDGSTDGSAAICDSYAEAYPEIFRVFHKQNEGLLMTRRFSLRQAQGEYILFVDSDDYVSPDLLQEVDFAFCQYGCDLLLYNFYRFCDGKEEYVLPQIPYKSGMVFEGEGKQELYRQFALKHTFSNMWIKAVARATVDIDEDYRPWNVSRGEDIIQSFALFDRAKKVVYIDKPLYYYRKNDGSVTSRVRIIDWKNYLTWTERTFLFLDRWFAGKELHIQFANRQMSHFYFYLRDIERKASREKNRTMLVQTVRALGTDNRYRHVLKLYDRHSGSKRLRTRLWLLHRWMSGSRWGLVCLLIRLSNTLGG